MNPLTQIKNTQKASKAEIAAGFSESASWHARFKHSAYIFAGGLPYDLTEGDLLAVFAQYGELVHVDLVKDKDTGKSRGFAFLAYEDQRSTVLAVDNLSGARVSKCTIRVEHVDNYKLKKAEVEGRQVSDSSEDEAEATPAEAGVPRGAASPPQAPGNDGDAWAGPGSVFALLREADPLPPPPKLAGRSEAQQAAGPDLHKQAKDPKKHKHKDKDKHKHKEKGKGKDRDEDKDRMRPKQERSKAERPPAARESDASRRPAGDSAPRHVADRYAADGPSEHTDKRQRVASEGYQHRHRDSEPRRDSHRDRDRRRE
ncbi:hypothetical protein WJX72_009752 [[Myrmecia] bisecta]|uniref:RRM domain-containing protein n=1 Tax=[Myrmecia] bisecta TaxID=41462 RepID=A0AAW1R954_9CHLO